MPCWGEEEGRKDRKKKRYIKGRGRKESLDWMEEAERKRKRESRLSGGRFGRKKEQWPIERRGNCLAKAIQHKQENSPRMEAEGSWWTSEAEGGGAVWQSHANNRLGRQEEDAMVPLLLLLIPHILLHPLFSCAGLCLAPLLSPLSPPLPPWPPLHR